MLAHPNNQRTQSKARETTPKMAKVNGAESNQASNDDSSGILPGNKSEEFHSNKTKINIMDFAG